MDGAPLLKIQLFGRIEAQIRGRPLPRMRSRKELWLLALLALERGRDVSRVWLAQTLWPSPDYSTELANNYLRRCLMELRKALGDQADRLQSTGSRAVCFSLDGADVDVLAFEAALARRDPASLAEAVERYGGPFLPECSEPWAAPLRERYAQAYGKALEELAARAQAVGGYEDAERYLRRAVASDPLSEAARRALMEAHGSRGDFAEALRVYHELDELLSHENGTPSEETTRLFRRLAAEARQAPRLASDAPPAVIASPSGYIPAPVTALVGREDDIVEVKAALGAARLVTLVGTGGVGKTRLALQVADEARPGFPDGAWFIDLAPLTDPGLVTQSVASVLGLRDDAAPSLEVALTDYLKPRTALIVLDNCEHLTDACALLVGRLLAHARHVRVLATSRHLLGLMGERVWRVPSLPAPVPEDLPEDAGEAARTVSASPAARLFAERAMAVDSRFAIGPGNARTVAQLCYRLDGIPLAIELAAARVRVLSVEEIAGRLDDRFRLLTSGSKTVLPRQQTLHALIDWSYNLLDLGERTLLTRLSVFLGGCTLEAAEAVCSGETLEAFEILDLLTALADKSLVFVDRDADGHSRYRLLENVRTFAAERLPAAETEAIRLRHAEWFASLVQRAEPRLRSGEQMVWLQRLTADRNNIRIAAEWSAAMPPDADLPLRLVTGLWKYWFTRGRFAEAHERLAGALANRTLAGKYAAWALFLQALFAELLGAEMDAPGVEMGLSIAAECGDPWLLAYGRYMLGWTQRSSDWDTGIQTIRIALTEARAQEDPWLIAEILNTLGFLELFHGQRQSARQRLEEAIVIARKIGDIWLYSELTYHLGLLHGMDAEHAQARDLFEQTLAHQEWIRDQHVIAAARHCIGWVSVAEGDYERASDEFRESLRIRAEAGFQRGMLACLEGLTVTAAAQGDDERAAVLLAALTRLRGAHNSGALQFWKFDPDHLHGQLKSHLAADRFSLSWSAGERLTLEEAVTLARDAENG